MTETDDLRAWIGRTETARDTLTPRLIEGLLATIDRDAAWAANAPVPATAHWCLTPPTLPMSALGPDGHPARGGFLPPVPLPRRMWAGGALEFHAPLETGDEVVRESRIADVQTKSGRTGPLVFVAVEHRFSTPRGLAVAERHDIVYRGEDTGAAPPPPPPETRPATWRREIMADPVLLFRYSALTFNGHRIHYDREYCQREEGYPGLVVHGPLQAALMVELAASARGGATPRRFAFRGTRPLFDGAPFAVNAAEAGEGLDLWVTDRDGRTTMTATVGW